MFQISFDLKIEEIVNHNLENVLFKSTQCTTGSKIPSTTKKGKFSKKKKKQFLEAFDWLRGWGGYGR